MNRKSDICSRASSNSAITNRFLNQLLTSLRCKMSYF